MKILVPIKRVIDYKTVIRIKADGSGIETANVKMSMNPFDEIAVEEALRLKEKGLAQEVIVVSIGNPDCQETIRTALAMGADRGIFIKTEIKVEPLATAKLLKTIALKESPTLIILGKQAIDTDNNQVGQMLAGLLSWSQGTFASTILLNEDQVVVTREIDGGLETLVLKLPAVITTDLRLNDPRYISLPNIIQAKRKSIEVIPAETLSNDLDPRVKTLTIKAPEKRGGGMKKFETASALVNCLKKEEQVI